jgi:hypothetical protein
MKTKHFTMKFPHELSPQSKHRNNVSSHRVEAPQNVMQLESNRDVQKIGPTKVCVTFKQDKHTESEKIHNERWHSIIKGQQEVSSQYIILPVTIHAVATLFQFLLTSILATTPTTERNTVATKHTFTEGSKNSSSHDDDKEKFQKEMEKVRIIQEILRVTNRNTMNRTGKVRKHRRPTTFTAQSGFRGYDRYSGSSNQSCFGNQNYVLANKMIQQHFIHANYLQQD